MFPWARSEKVTRFRARFAYVHKTKTWVYFADLTISGADYSRNRPKWVKRFVINFSKSLSDTETNDTQEQ